MREMETYRGDATESFCESSVPFVNVKNDAYRCEVARRATTQSTVSLGFNRPKLIIHKDYK